MKSSKSQIFKVRDKLYNLFFYKSINRLVSQFIIRNKKKIE